MLWTTDGCFQRHIFQLSRFSKNYENPIQTYAIPAENNTKLMISLNYENRQTEDVFSFKKSYFVGCKKQAHHGS